MNRYASLLAAACLLLSPFAHAGGTWIDPVSGQTYAASAAAPAHDKARSAPKVALARVRMLTEQPELERRVSIAALSEFIRRVEAQAESAFSHNGTRGAVLVDFTCKPGRAAVEIGSQGGVHSAALEDLHYRLQSMTPLAVRGEVAFQTEFHLHP